MAKMHAVIDFDERSSTPLDELESEEQVNAWLQKQLRNIAQSARKEDARQAWEAVKLSAPAPVVKSAYQFYIAYCIVIDYLTNVNLNLDEDEQIPKIAEEYDYDRARDAFIKAIRKYYKIGKIPPRIE
jgi:hypothetical protein